MLRFVWCSTIDSAVLWGLLLQSIAYAVVMPIYLIWHLSTSPTVVPSKVNISVKASELYYVKYSIIMGYLIPSALLALPSPFLLSYEMKQGFIAFWQAFPIWVGLLQQLFTYTFAKSKTSISISMKVDDRNTINTFRSTYAFLLAMAGLSQMLTIVVMLVSMIRGLGSTGVFHLAEVMIPSAITPSARVPSIGQGAFLLLQYDELVGNTTILVWAIFMYITAFQGDKIPPYKKLMVQIICWTLLFGPIGCALILIWSRDELIYKPPTTAEITENLRKEGKIRDLQRQTQR